MIAIIATAIGLLAFSVWWLSRALSRPMSEDEQRAQREQYLLARDRLLLELEQLDAARDNNDIDQALVTQEGLRLETELAGVLRLLEQQQPAASSGGVAPAHIRLIVVSLLALWLPVSALVFYLSSQGEELLWLAGFSRQDSAMPINQPRQAMTDAGQQQFPPEVMEMVARLERRLQQDPSDGEGWKRLGRAYSVLGRRDEAVTAYSRAAELLNGDSDVQQALQQLNAEAVTTASADASGQQQFPPQVMQMVAQLEQRLQQDPSDGEGWKRLGRSYMVMGRYNEAVSAYSSAAELLPNDKDVEQALQQLAAIAAAGDKHPQTDEGADKTRAAHPPLPAGSLERIVGLERQVGAEPGNAMAWANLAHAYAGIGRDQDAERAWAEAHTQAPDNPAILAAYAGSVFNANPRDPEGKALALYKQLHALAPQHPDGLWFLGLAAYSEGNIAETRRLWKELLGVLPPGSEGYNSVSEALAGVERLFNTPK